MIYENPFLIYAVGRALGTNQIAISKDGDNYHVTQYNDQGSIVATFDSLEKIKNLQEHYVFVETDILSTEVRKKRDRLLLESDWTQTAEQSEDTKTKWRPYRQALRDITSQNGFPKTVVFPQKP